MEKDELSLVNLQTGEISLMPLGNDLIKEDSLKGKIAREFFLTEKFSKFIGLCSDYDFLSEILIKSGEIPENVVDRYRNNEYSLNTAFSDRGDRQNYPLKSDNLSQEIEKGLMSSPADSYLTIREIKNKKIELYPELTLDLVKMIGEENSAKFEDGGKFMLFTLKPHHDHTIDYPFDSKVISEPKVFSSKDGKIKSTSLDVAKFMAKNNLGTTFDENHRVITELLAKYYNETYFMLEVGAVTVNSIDQDNCVVGEEYTRGVQKSHFNFGSTVIILLPDSFSQKLKVLDVFSRDLNTSVEIKRRNVIAIVSSIVNEDLSEGDQKKFEIANGVQITLKRKKGKIEEVIERRKSREILEEV